MNQPLSLNSVVNQFTSWREAPHKGSHTPKRLKQQAIALKSHYPVGQIINALKINHRSLKRWSLHNAKEQPTAFISLPAPKVVNNPIATQFIASCEFPNGVQLKLTHESINANLLSLIYQLKSEDER